MPLVVLIHFFLLEREDIIRTPKRNHTYRTGNSPLKVKQNGVSSSATDLIYHLNLEKNENTFG